MPIYPDSIDLIVCERIDKAHAAIRHAIHALADSLIQSGVLVHRDQMEEMAQGVAEALSDDIVDEVRQVRDANGDVDHYPEDYDTVIDAAVERVTDSFRPKAVTTAALFDSLRPVVTNPATHADLGKPL